MKKKLIPDSRELKNRPGMKTLNQIIHYRHVYLYVYLRLTCQKTHTMTSATTDFTNAIKQALISDATLSLYP
jgi:hypothetical protein